MDQKICCVTGHRVIPVDKVDCVIEALRVEVAQAIKEGFTTFISGFADGVDLLFAEVVQKEKTRNPKIFLEAAIPYRNRIFIKNKQFQRLLVGCDAVYVQQEKYMPNCLLNRNRYMVSRSQRIIAVYDGREKGGTAFTIRYARTLDKEVHIIVI